MLRFHTLSSAGFTLAAAFLLAGCQAAGHKPAPGATAGKPSTDAVACDKCKVVWAKEAITAGGGKSDHVVGYTTQKQMVCPDCRSAVHNMFTTGKFQHTCTACGGDLEPCAVH
jgi:uncharacterized lipoprotein YajG